MWNLKKIFNYYILFKWMCYNTGKEISFGTFVCKPVSIVVDWQMSLAWL